jgi:hypothetical protein
MRHLPSARENSPFGQFKLNPTIAAIGVLSSAGIDRLKFAEASCDESRRPLLRPCQRTYSYRVMIALRADQFYGSARRDAPPAQRPRELTVRSA